MLYLWDIIGTYVFCVSGAIAARQKDMDWFGMFMLALITGTGGGTLRSMMIGDTPPPIFKDPIYLFLAAGAVMTALFAAPYWEKRRRIVSAIDAIGLGVFVCIGVQVALNRHLDWWAAVGMGVITATFGGVIRDVVRTEVPLIFRKEIYATACAIGGLIYLALESIGAPSSLNSVATVVSVASIRLLAIRYALNQSS